MILYNVHIVFQEVIKKLGEEQPDLKNWLETHQDAALKLVDKYFECDAKPTLEKALVLYKEE